MKLTFFGAAGEVTGSCTLVETGQTKVLVDCGYFQGSSMAYEHNAAPFPFNPAEIDALIITHAHIDHIGRVPKLVREGFAGRIFSTHPTRLISKMMWQDAADVMRSEAKLHHKDLIYGRQHINAAYALMHGVNYETRVKIADGVHVTFREAGHVFGSAFVEMEVGERRVVFSGDLGNDNAPILRDTEDTAGGDVIVLESTYGDREHEDPRFRTDRLKEVALKSIRSRGTLLIPAFSLERTQEILYELNSLVENGELPRVPIFLDSPLAIRMLPVYKQFSELYDRDAKELRNAGDDFFRFPGLEVTKKPAESDRIHDVKPPKIIIAGSGMMHGGRIMKHLHDHLDDPNTTVLVIGYQAGGTTGRALSEGAKKVTVEHDVIEVRAKLEVIGAYSAHADRKKLLRWAQSGRKPGLVILNHGEDGPRQALAADFKAVGIETRMPALGDDIEV
jgi:metallo-beta-lactamase family protein